MMMLGDGAFAISGPSDHRCTAETNVVRCSTVSLTAKTGEPYRFAPQVAGSVSE